MASAFIEREGSGESLRYRVRYRLGGRDTPKLSAGSFAKKKHAQTRRDWVAGELAAMRVPDLEALAARQGPTLTLREVAERWRRSRVDVSDGTAATYAVNLGRVLPTLGQLEPHAITAADVAALVAELHEDDGGEGLARESIRKTLSTLAMVLDFAKVVPNPARDTDVRLPHEARDEVDPPIAMQVEAAFWLMPPGYKLPMLVYDATGMRASELEGLRWRDVDEPGRRWRVSRIVTKTKRSRWVPVSRVIEPCRAEVVFDAVTMLVPREDRARDAQVFAGFSADAFRTSLARACRNAGVPDFSPHDLRDRRATLWHLAGVPVAQAAEWLGHSPNEHLKTYVHATLDDRTELDYERLLASIRGRDDLLGVVVPGHRRGTV